MGFAKIIISRVRKKYEGNLGLCDHEDSESGTFAEIGTTALWKNQLSENAKVGMGEYEGSDGSAGGSYARDRPPSFFLLLPDTTSWKRI